MKLAFSTLSCPSWSFKSIRSAAIDLGYDGIEIRGIENNLFVPDIAEFSDVNGPKTIAELKAKKITVPIFSSSCYLFDQHHPNQMMQEGIAYVDCASRCHVDFVRVLCDKDPHASDIDFEFTVMNLINLAMYAADMDVTLLVETNGYFADSDNMEKLLERVEGLPVMVLWDVHHTWRYHHEKPAVTIDKIGEYIRFVHIKDSLPLNGSNEYKLIGEGDIPIKEAVKALKEIDYQGFLSLEWLKRWHTNIEEPWIVLPQYLQYMREII
ncbi:MAG: sugar phosphate isomerase/epimerase [Clostridia bacterium]|nr:sugar phosphate isomerase/epimerase [Clostridia bacterium]